MNRSFSDFELLYAALPNLNIQSISKTSYKDIIRLIQSNLTQQDLTLLKQELRFVLPFCIRNFAVKNLNKTSQSVAVKSFIQHFKELKNRLIENSEIVSLSKSENEIKESFSNKNYALGNLLFYNECISHTYIATTAKDNRFEQLIAYCIHYIVLLSITYQTELRSIKNLEGIMQKHHFEIAQKVKILFEEIL